MTHIERYSEMLGLLLEAKKLPCGDITKQLGPNVTADFHFN